METTNMSIWNIDNPIWDEAAERARKADAEAARSRCHAIAAMYDDPDQALKILDPEYTYWSERGDTSRNEHISWLVGASEEAIRGWLDSILCDINA